MTTKEQLQFIRNEIAKKQSRIRELESEVRQLQAAKQSIQDKLPKETKDHRLD